MKSYRIKIYGRSYNIEIEDAHATPVHVSVDGKPYEVSIEKLQTDFPTTLRTEKNSIAKPSVTAPFKPPAFYGQIIIAPMPGKITEIKINTGDNVTRGQELCILEAMKMKNSIKSPRDGAIASVRINEGQTVAYGDTLFEFV